MKLSFRYLSIILTSLLLVNCTTVKPPVIEDISNTKQVVSKTIVEKQERSLKRKVAIARFSNETKYGRGFFDNENEDRLGKQVMDILSSKLVNTEKFLLLERSDLDQIAKEKDIYLKKARDQQSSANLYNGNNSKIYKKGGKLIPRFRRGGELDLEKENVILDGPSHDDHNKTGVKGDKGLPVVNKGTKVAEIESLELILNKNSSVKLENLAKEYKKTGDVKILNKIGEVMKKEINDNTYDYSKEIL